LPDLCPEYRRSARRRSAARPSDCKPRIFGI
jgi:hypothetical protein